MDVVIDNRKSIIPFVVIALLTINFILSATTLNLNGFPLRVISIVLLILYFFLNNKKVSIKFILISFVLITYYLVFKQSVALNAFVLYLLSYTMKDINIKYLKDKLLLILTFAVGIWIILLLTNTINDIQYAWYNGVRHGLGFININHSSILYVPFFLLIYEKYNYKSLPFILPCIIILFKYTLTRTSLIIVLLYIILEVLVRKKLFENGRSKRIISILTIIVVIVFTSLFGFSSNLMTRFVNLDFILSGRLGIINQGINNLTWFNYLFGLKELLLDNSFIMFLSTFGIIAFAWFLKKVYNAFLYYEKDEWLLMLVILIYGFFESIILIPESIIAIIFFIYLQKSNNTKVPVSHQ